MYFQYLLCYINTGVSDAVLDLFNFNQINLKTIIIFIFLMLTLFYFINIIGISK